MNKSNARDYLPLVQALAEGKVIQMLEGHGYWVDMVEISSDIPASLYRIKPEPREIWSNRFSGGYETPAQYKSEEQAKLCDSTCGGAVQVLYREVIE